ncbi:hypothetical protein WN943_018833 [Citrus x changshan-huyou]
MAAWRDHGLYNGGSTVVTGADEIGPLELEFWTVVGWWRLVLVWC